MGSRRRCPRPRLPTIAPSIVRSVSCRKICRHSWVEAGREAAFDSARLKFEEIEQRPDLFGGQLPPPWWHGPLAVLLGETAAVEDLREHLLVRSALSEEQPLPMSP